MAGLIYEVLPKVSADIGAIAKDQTNTFHRYKFRGVDDVLNCCGPVLARHGVLVSPSVSEHKISATPAIGKNGKEGGTLYHCTLLMAVRFSAADGSSVEVVTAGEAHDTNGDKATNKAMAAAYKYAFFFGLCLPVDPSCVDDSDREQPSRIEQAAERYFATHDSRQSSPPQNGNAQPAAHTQTEIGGHTEASGHTETKQPPGRTQEELQDAAADAIAKADSIDALEKIAKGVRAKIEDSVARNALLDQAADKIRAIRNGERDTAVVH